MGWFGAMRLWVQVYVLGLRVEALGDPKGLGS